MGTSRVGLPPWLCLALLGVPACELAPPICVESAATSGFDISAGWWGCDDKSGTSTLRIDDADADAAHSPRILWQISYIAVEDAATGHFEYGVVPPGYVVDVAATPLLGVCNVRVYSNWSGTTVPATVVGGAPCGR